MQQTTRMSEATSGLIFSNFMRPAGYGDSPDGQSLHRAIPDTRLLPLKNRVRAQANFVNRIKLIWVVQSPRKKYFASVFQKTMLCFAHPASMQRGVTANRHET